MDVQHIGELLSEILQRLDIIEEFLTSSNRQRTYSRQQSLERYRIAYQRQYGVPSYSISEEPEDGFDEVD